MCQVVKHAARKQQSTRRRRLGRAPHYRSPSNSAHSLHTCSTTCCAVYRPSQDNTLDNNSSESSASLNSDRERCGERVDNLTVAEALSQLAAEGHNVDRVWERIDALVGAVLRSFTQWQPLKDQPALERLFLLTGIDLRLRDSGEGVYSVFLESNHTPLLANFGPPEVDRDLEQGMRGWLRLLRDQAAQSTRLTAGTCGYRKRRTD